MDSKPLMRILLSLALLKAVYSLCDLNGTWCCETTTVLQIGNHLYTNGSYGTGDGFVFWNGSILINFSNSPTVISGQANAACSSISWSDNNTWTRAWPGPATPPPAWIRNLSIYELNPRAYTSPNGTGDGSGSGTWQSLSARLPYLQSLGVTGLWVAGSALAETHFYNIWTTYATKDVRVLDPVLGSADDFKSFVTSAHNAGMRVFLDVTTHGICNDSVLVTEYPSYFSGGSWGMVDYNYANPDFFSWWSGLWVGWVTEYGIDGFRLDIADTDGELAGFDAAALAGVSIGHEIAVFGETRRYHFMQHDTTFSISQFSDMVGYFESSAAPNFCYATLQISCHDSGWESGPGDYFTLKGSRAWFGYAGVFGVNIPLFMGGEEYNEDPVIGLPDLEKDLYGGGGPGGWLYGTQRQWDQITTNASKAATLKDYSAIFAIARANADLLHHDRCGASLVRIPFTLVQAANIVAVPYARYLDGVKAILIFANADPSADAVINASVPLEAMNLAGMGTYRLSDLWGSNGGGSRTLPEAQLASIAVSIPRDVSSGGGLAVFLVEPV